MHKMIKAGLPETHFGQILPEKRKSLWKMYIENSKTQKVVAGEGDDKGHCPILADVGFSRCRDQ